MAWMKNFAALCLLCLLNLSLAAPNDAEKNNYGIYKMFDNQMERVVGNLNAKNITLSSALLQFLPGFMAYQKKGAFLQSNQIRQALDALRASGNPGKMSADFIEEVVRNNVPLPAFLTKLSTAAKDNKINTQQIQGLRKEMEDSQQKMKLVAERRKNLTDEIKKFPGLTRNVVTQTVENLMKYNFTDISDLRNIANNTAVRDVYSRIMKNLPDILSKIKTNQTGFLNQLMDVGQGKKTAENIKASFKDFPNTFSDAVKEMNKGLMSFFNDLKKKFKSFEDGFKSFGDQFKNVFKNS